MLASSRRPVVAGDEDSLIRNYRGQLAVLAAVSANSPTLKPNFSSPLEAWGWVVESEISPDFLAAIRKERLYGASGGTLAHHLAHCPQIRANFVDFVPNELGRFAGINHRWARRVSNLRPLACEASALPLSYAP